MLLFIGSRTETPSRCGRTAPSVWGGLGGRGVRRCRGGEEEVEEEEEEEEESW
jgi:hypothetical protein